MSRGSTFTLYRAYNIFKVDKEKIESIRNEYVEYNRKNLQFRYWPDSRKTEEEQKAELDDRCKNDIPLILEETFDRNRDYQYGDKKYQNVDEYRRDNYQKYILSTDGRSMDKLLEWDFTSGFDCLINEWNLSYYNFKNNEYIIDVETAKQLLAAAEYLLGGEYSDSIERSMNNPYIHILSEGCTGDCYWKYVHRKRNARKMEKFTFGDDDTVKVTVEIPKKKKSEGEDGGYGDEDEYAAEIDDSNNTQELYFRKLSNALSAFLESYSHSYDEETELILVYSCWG